MDPAVSETKFHKFRCNDSCACNNQIALVERLLRNAQPGGITAPFPQFDMTIEAELNRTFDAFATCFTEFTSGEPLTGYETKMAFKGRNSEIESQLGVLGFHTSVADPKRYERVSEELARILAVDEDSFRYHVIIMMPELYTKWGHIRPFAKVESISVEKFPRNISPRDPKFNFLWAQFTKPLESYFYTHLSAMGALSIWCPYSKEPGVSNPWIGKSLNKIERAMAVQYKFDLFRKMHGCNPFVFQTDCRGFDAHVTSQFTKCENRFYAKCYPKYAWYVKQLTKTFEINTFSGDGIRGKVKGARMSGDMHTGLGNTIDDLAMLVTSFRLMNIKRYDLFSDGDDTLVFVHPDDVEIVRTQLPQFFLRMGHELTVDGITDDIMQVTWCQSKIVRVLRDGQTVPMFVQNPLKTFATMGSHIHARTAKEAEQYFSDVCYAHSVLYSTIPLFRKLGLMRANREVRTRRISPGLSHELLKHRNVHVEEGPDTMSDYCQAFGIPPSLYRGDGLESPSEIHSAIVSAFSRGGEGPHTGVIS